MMVYTENKNVKGTEVEYYGNLIVNANQLYDALSLNTEHKKFEDLRFILQDLIKAGRIEDAEELAKIFDIEALIEVLKNRVELMQALISFLKDKKLKYTIIDDGGYKDAIYVEDVGTCNKTIVVVEINKTDVVYSSFNSKILSGCNAMDIEGTLTKIFELLNK